MAAPSQLRLEGDLPAVPSADLEPAWDKEVSPSNAAVFKEFVKWVRAEELPATPDAGLVKFIHSCDYEIEKAQKCAKDFYSSREDNSELFANWDISLPNFQSILDVIGVAIVPRRTPTNCRVVINSLKTSDTTNYVIADVCKVTLMVIESIFLTEPTIDGIIVIHDLEKITFSHFIKMLWSMPRKIQTYFQDGIPIKRDRVHLINCPSLIDRGLQLMRHLGRKEDWDKLRVYKGDDFSELHSYVPPDCLPSELGGTVATLGELQAMTIQRLQDFKDIFRKSLLEEL